MQFAAWFYSVPKQLMATALLISLHVKLPLWKYDLEPSSFHLIHNYIAFLMTMKPLVSHAVCSVSHLFGLCLFFFFLVWRICSVACLLDQLALGTPMHTKSLKQMEKFDFQREKDSIATLEWNIHLVTFTASLLLQTKHPHTHKCNLERNI